MYDITSNPQDYFPGYGEGWSHGGGGNPYRFRVYSMPRTITGLDHKKGERVPYWRQKVDRGEFAASAYERNVLTVSASPVNMLATNYLAGWGKAWVEFSGLVFNPALPAKRPILATVSNRALSRILEKVRFELEHVNVLPALAELQQTIRMFGAPFSSIISLSNRRLNRLHLEWRGLKGSVAFRRVKWERIVASSYLEYAFGLKPLIEDTRSVAEALARWNAEAEGDLPMPTRTILRSRAETVYTTTSTDPAVFPFSGANFVGYRRRVDITETDRVAYMVKLRNSLQARFGTNERLMQLLGFNALTFIPTLWEVLPWSWLADYFINVQEIIEAGVTATSNVEWIVRSELVKTEKTETALTYLTNNTVCSSPHLSRYYSTRADFTRSLPPSFGLPAVVVGFPNTVTKLANATAALLARRAHAQALWVF